MYKNNSTSPLFLSLRWKYALSISAVLFLIHAILSFSIFHQNNQLFEQKLKTEYNKQTDILGDLILQSQTNMEQFIDSINLLQQSSKSSIYELINTNWLDWKLIWGYKNLNLYTKITKQHSNWGESNLDLTDLYQLVIKTERPQQQIYCNKNCLLYIATPIIKQGKLVAVLSVSNSLADTLINFNRITETDTGIVLLNKDHSVTVAALTNTKKNSALLRKVLAINPNISLKAQHVQFNNNHFYINFYSITKKKNTGNKQAYFIFIKNINQILENQQKDKNNILIIGFFSLLSTFIVLYALLHHSVVKIRAFSTALPYLTMKPEAITTKKTSDKYQITRQLLPKQNKSHFFSDELDQLQLTSLNLCNQLESLEKKNELVNKQSYWIATHDELTNLNNRHYFQKEFGQQINTAERYGQKLALFYLDLDQFKVINDRYGHEAGDKLLIEVANNLKTLIRNTDTLCRIGGDEFAILTPVTDDIGIMSLAIKINHTLNEIIFKRYKNTYRVGASIGIAVYPNHGKSIHELLANADLAMYKAKETSFNIYHIYDKNIDYHQELNKKLDWKELIDQAIQNNWLNLYYQPIMDLKTNTISHYECLLRVIKDTGEMIMPADFIQYAEELGLIETVDIIIINLAIKKHIELQNTGQKDLKLAINLSGRSLSNDKVKTEIKLLLALSKVYADKIIFEITETAAVTNFNVAQFFINEIKELGCSIALDDFGTGFSSFFYLKNMTVDYIKIDGSFIQRIESDKEDKIFVKALSDVARALNKKTIAEFVETENIITILKELNIDYAQGYYISKPLPHIPKQ